MGTRNLTAVMMGGEYRVAQYGQWDGYPNGQGRTVLEFCRAHLKNVPGRDNFMERISRCRLVEQQEIERMWRSVGAVGDLATLDQAREFKQKWPTLSRDTGGKVFDMIWDAEGEILLCNSIDFAADSLFCEWAYVINLDKQTLEVFKGFNKEPLPEGERFANMPRTKEDGEYYPVKHLKTWSLDKLPRPDTFVKQLEKLAYLEEEEAAE